MNADAPEPMQKPIHHAIITGTGGVTASSADGLIQFAPPQTVICIAVRVDVPENKMITGLKWYNGSGSQAFPRILVATGNGFEPRHTIRPWRLPRMCRGKNRHGLRWCSPIRSPASPGRCSS